MRPVSLAASLTFNIVNPGSAVRNPTVSDKLSTAKLPFVRRAASGKMGSKEPLDRL